LMTGVGEAGTSVDTGAAPSHAASSVTRVAAIVSCRSVCSPLSGLLSVPRYTVVHTWLEDGMHSRYEVERVLSLVAEGLNDCQISRTTGISRRTILDWRHGRVPGESAMRAASPRSCPRCEGGPLGEPAYSYLLGPYLGDGWLSRDPRANRLRIVQDARYPHLIRLATASINHVRDGKGKVGTARKAGCIEIYASWQHWPCLFPQHGPVESICGRSCWRTGSIGSFAPIHANFSEV
jgi:hypothetical protein